MDSTYYDILGVDRDISPDALKKAWYKLSLKYHPDRLSEEEQNKLGDKMKEINEAYDILSDPKKRAIYDKHGKKGLQGMGERDTRKSPVPTIEITVVLTLEELYSGTSQPLSFERNTLCKDCDGHGTKSKKEAPKCGQCGGKGHTFKRVPVGPFMQNVPIPCTSCRATGIKAGTAFCTKCNGKRGIKEKVTLVKDIPPGLSNNTGFHILEEGHEIPKQFSHMTDFTRGKVLVIIKEKEHPIFKRLGGNNKLDIATTIELTLAEALCGFKRTIEHINGRKLFITGDHINDCDIKVIKGKGMPDVDDPTNYGDLVVQFEVAMEFNYDKAAVYKALTGSSLDDVDFTVPKDHDYCPLLDEEERDEVHQEAPVGCATQ